MHSWPYRLPNHRWVGSRLSLHRASLRVVEAWSGGSPSVRGLCRHGDSGNIAVSVAIYYNWVIPIVIMKLLLCVRVMLGDFWSLVGIGLVRH
jgi:hypothetical protein